MSEQDRLKLLEAWPWPQEAATTAGGFSQVIDAVDAIIDVHVDRIRAEALAVGWQVGHDEVCDLGVVCSRHQPIEAKADQPFWADRITTATALRVAADQK